MNRDDEEVLRRTWNSFHDGMCEILKTTQDEAYELGLKRGGVETERLQKLSDELRQERDECLDLATKMRAERDRYKSAVDTLMVRSCCKPCDACFKTLAEAVRG